ncbi:aminotransferase class I/II-fold pyridoxal phosphate-dependent enzyme [Rhodobacteraceae bacterium CCMM004]|nr:aminotransferase class I/II-fold pyridoxal phosphate-dependent enzyme [Rhodobacteraceae bacterium CCMM004]
MTDAPAARSSAHDADPIPPAAADAVAELMASGDLFRYTAAADAPVTLLEREFAAALGSRHAVAVSSCSAALFLALRALDPAPGARVLIPAFTFAAVPSAVLHAGCVPVLAECGADYRLDMDDVAAKLPGCSALLVSHMRGHTSDMDALVDLADRHGVPLIEDAAHSLGTTWRGRKIGTLGAMGCFSFQSYKMLNGGEGGILITDDADLAARVIVMSGAYEHNWSKHDIPTEAMARWQNRLPLYNTRMSNLSAAVIRPQIPLLPARVAAGRRNHDALAARLAPCPHLSVPAPLEGEARAPDSIQFNLVGISGAQADAFAHEARRRGAGVSIFGRSEDNARAFWNWGFLDDVPDLPQTRAMLMRACDLRLPVRTTAAEIDALATAIIGAVEAVAPAPRFGT